MTKGITTWKNWSESVHCSDIEYVEPNSLEALRHVVKECYEKGRNIRVVGSGHSFTPLVATNDVFISINRLQGISSIHSDGYADVWAGTTLKALGALLFEKGYAMKNLGDINEQTLAGAISTGTHGTGTQLGNIPSQVRAVTLLTAEGELMEISPESNAEYLNAVKVSLGMLGIIVKVELKVVPAYKLVSESYRLTLDKCFSQLESLKNDNRNMEFYWFPYTKKVQVKTMNRHDENIDEMNKKRAFIKKVLIENGVFWMMSETSRLIPRSAGVISKLSAQGVPVGKEYGSSHQLFTTPRLVKFQEMEYCIPKEMIKAAIKDIEKIIEKRRFNVHFPIECRFVQNDDIWLSPSYKRDSAYIAVHMYKGMDFQAYFSAVEEVCQHYHGRPHWGKMHKTNGAYLAKQYPQLQSFLQLRKKLDPHGMFVNEYLGHLFDIK